MLEWLNWSNTLYLAGILLGGVLTLVSLKYRSLLKEIQDVSTVLSDALEDKKLTKAEKEAVMKEVLDVLRESVRLVWRF